MLQLRIYKCIFCCGGFSSGYQSPDSGECQLTVANNMNTCFLSPEIPQRKFPEIVATEDRRFLLPVREFFLLQHQETFFYLTGDRQIDYLPASFRFENGCL